MKKICIVTGGSNGIGEAVVDSFLLSDFSVYNFDIIQASKANFIYCDVSSSDSVKNAVKQVIDVEGRIDILVASAGVFFSGNVELTSEIDFDRLIDINVKGTYLILKESVSYMKKNGGSIVLISSDQAFIGKKNSFAYNASKAAVAAMAKTIAIDYAEFNIRCNAVCPGTIDTPLYRKAIQSASEITGLSVEKINTDEANMQLLRRIGKSSEVADFVSFLCGDKSAFVTGSLHAIDGGYTAC